MSKSKFMRMRCTFSVTPAIYGSIFVCQRFLLLVDRFLFTSSFALLSLRFDLLGAPLWWFLPVTIYVLTMSSCVVLIIQCMHAHLSCVKTTTHSMVQWVGKQHIANLINIKWCHNNRIKGDVRYATIISIKSDDKNSV